MVASSSQLEQTSQVTSLGSSQPVGGAGARLYLSALRESTSDTINVQAVAHNPVPTAEKQDALKPVTSVPAPAKSTLSRDAALAMLQAQLSTHFAVEGNLQIDLLRPWQEPVKATSPYSLTIVEYPNILSSNILVRARLESSNVPTSEITLSLRAQLWREVWATREPVARDDVFDPAALEPRRVDCLRERDTISANSGDRSQTYARNIQAGRLLSWRDLTKRSLVRKGDLVDVAAVDGPLTISMKALAMQSGTAGETIMVRNVESKKDIAAQVISENRVKVRF